MKTDTMVERRIGSRVSVDLPVDLLVDGFPHRCRVTDLSSTGMMVSLTRSLALRDASMLGKYEIHGGARPIQVTARLVWQRDGRQAARFVAVPEDEREAISALVQSALWSARGDLERLEQAERRDQLTR